MRFPGSDCMTLRLFLVLEWAPDFTFLDNTLGDCFKRFTALGALGRFLLSSTVSNRFKFQSFSLLNAMFSRRTWYCFLKTEANGGYCWYTLLVRTLCGLHHFSTPFLLVDLDTCIFSFPSSDGPCFALDSVRLQYSSVTV